MTSNRSGKKQSSGGRSGSARARSGGAVLSPTMQWVALAGAAVLVIVAVFVFGIGRGNRTTYGNTGGGHGLGAQVQPS